MKQFILSLVFLFLTSFVNSQVFNGVPIKGNLQTCIANFKQKGFTFIKYNEYGATMSGVVANKQVELYIIMTPKSKVVCKLSMYFSKQQGWSSLYSEYSKVKEMLTLKYGEPDYISEEFITPYKLGDGYETTALEIEKCNYNSIWLYKDNTNIVVEISKYLQIYLSYENEDNMKIKKIEENSVNYNTF